MYVKTCLRPEGLKRKKTESFQRFRSTYLYETPNFASKENEEPFTLYRLFLID